METSERATRYAVRIAHEVGATTYLRGHGEVRDEHQAERFASEGEALDAGFLFVLRRPGTTYDVIEMEGKQ